MTGWLADWLIYWLSDWLAGWLADWLTDCLTDWLADWLADYSNQMTAMRCTLSTFTRSFTPKIGKIWGSHSGGTADSFLSYGMWRCVLEWAVPTFRKVIVEHHFNVTKSRLAPTPWPQQCCLLSRLFSLRLTVQCLRSVHCNRKRLSCSLDRHGARCTWRLQAGK